MVFPIRTRLMSVRRASRAMTISRHSTMSQEVPASTRPAARDAIFRIGRGQGTKYRSIQGRSESILLPAIPSILQKKTKRAVMKFPTSRSDPAEFCVMNITRKHCWGTGAKQTAFKDKSRSRGRFLLLRHNRRSVPVEVRFPASPICPVRNIPIRGNSA